MDEPRADLEAERAILGAILLVPAAFVRVAGTLTAEDFHDPGHAWIYRAIDTVLRKGLPLDVVTLSAELAALGILNTVGGAQRLGDLTDAVATAAHIEAHADLVVEHARARQVREAARALAARAAEPGADLAALVAAFATATTPRGSGALEPFDEAAGAFFEHVEAAALARAAGRAAGVPTGLRGLDTLLGGLQGGKVIVLAARPAMGKSALAGLFADAAATAGHGVLYVSQEMLNWEVVRLAWPLVEPSAPLCWSWHLDALCEHLVAVTRREIRDLVINIPPGCSKSLSSSVLWPGWQWTFDPGHRWLAASYGDRVVTRDAEKMRTLVKSAWYRARWPGVEIPQGKAQSDAVLVFRTTAGGMRYSQTVRGQWTGEHGDTLLVDDPIDPQRADAASGIEVDAVLAWWTGTMPSRFRNHRTSARVCIMQRLHVRDLAGEMIRAGATVLCLPMRFERAHPLRWIRDPRTADGALLVPDRIPEDEAARLETILGPSRVAAQFQQRPAPAAGGLFQRAWLRQYWTVLPKGGVWTLSADLAFKGTADADFVCLQVWYQLGANFYLVDQVLARLDFNATCDAIVALAARYPRATRKLVEDKANGPAVIVALQRKVPGLVAVNPEGGKVARAHGAEPLFAAGNVFLPHPLHAEYDDGRRGAPWVRGPGVGLDAPEAAAGSYEHTLVTFPNGDHDDPVDATTQYLNHAATSYAARLQAAMARVGPGGTTRVPQDPP